METKKENPVDYLVAITAILSTVTALNYYFSFYVISRIFFKFDINTFSLLSMEDMLFPFGYTNERVFLMILVLMGGFVLLFYLLNHTYEKKAEQLKKWFLLHRDGFMRKYWYVIVGLILPIGIWLYYVEDGIYFILSVLIALCFNFSRVLSVRNYAVLFIIFICFVHLFYDFILKQTSDSNTPCPQHLIETQDHRLFRTGEELKIVFWGTKYVILNDVKSGKLELIPTAEIKHAMIEIKK